MVGTVPLNFTGTGLVIPVSWAISGSPTTSFGGVYVGSAHSLTVSMINGGGTGNLPNPTLSGVNAGDFAVSNQCSNIAQDGVCNVVVTFTPSALGTETATVTIAGATLTYIGQGTAIPPKGKYTMRIYAPGVKQGN